MTSNTFSFTSLARMLLMAIGAFVFMMFITAQSVSAQSLGGDLEGGSNDRSFSIGDLVETTDILKVRNGLGAYLGTQPALAIGKILSGPRTAGEFAYWEIDFNSGFDGWSAAPWLREVSDNNAGLQDQIRMLLAMIASMQAQRAGGDDPIENMGVTQNGVFMNIDAHDFDSDHSAGQEDVGIIEIDIEAQDSDIVIEDVFIKLTQLTRGLGFDDFESFGLWYEGNKIAEVDSSKFSNGVLRIPLVNTVEVEVGEEIELIVAASIANAAPSGTWEIAVTNLSYLDLEARGTDSIGNDDDRVRFMVRGEGTDSLVVRSSADDPDATTFQIETDDVSDDFMVFAFDLETEDNEDDVELFQIILDVDLYNVKDGTVAEDVIHDAALIIDGERIDSDLQFTNRGQLLLFTDLEYYLDEDDSVTVEVEVRFESANEAEGIGFDISTEQILAVTDDGGGTQITAEGSAQGEKHALRSEGIITELVSVDEELIENSDATSSDDEGQFIIEFDVTAFESDIYINPTTRHDGGGGQGTEGFTFNLRNSNFIEGAEGASIASISSTAGRERSGRYRIDEGETEGFELVVRYTPEESGSYQMQLFSINYNTVDANPNRHVRPQDAEDFETDFLVIDGSGVSTDPNNNPSVDVELIRTSRSIRENSDATETDDEGVFEITFEVTADDGDVFVNQIPSHVSIPNRSDDELIVFIEKSGRRTSNYDSLALTLESSAEQNGEYYEVQEGETETFTVTIELEPKESGIYRVGITSPFVFSNDDGNGDTLESRISESTFRTGYLVINGGPDEVLETTGTYQVYIDGKLAVTARNTTREYATNSCKSAAKDSAKSYRCTWNGIEVYKTEAESVSTQAVPTLVMQQRVNGSRASDRDVTVNEGDDLNLYWKTTGATSCTFSTKSNTKDRFNGWDGDRDSTINGDDTTVGIPDPGKTDNYGIVCRGPGGSVGDSINVTTRATETEVEKGTYQGYVDGRLFITTRDIERSYAIDNCKLNASKNPTKSYRCTWNNTEVYKVDATEVKNEVVEVATPVVAGPIPVPARPSHACSADGKTLTMNWRAPAGYDTFYFRMQDNKTGARINWDENLQATTKKVSVTPGQSYTWWVHTKRTSDSKWSTSVKEENIVCDAPVVAAPTVAKGTYLGYLDNRQFIRTASITEADALANCKLNARNNPTKAVRCTWNGGEIYKAEGEKVATPVAVKAQSDSSLPKPNQPMHFCRNDNTRMVMRWDAPAGSDNFYFRMRDSATKTRMNWEEKYSRKSIGVDVTPGVKYDWWVHVRDDATGNWSNHVGEYGISCGGSVLGASVSVDEVRAEIKERLTEIKDRLEVLQR